MSRSLPSVAEKRTFGALSVRTARAKANTRYVTTLAAGAASGGFLFGFDVLPMITVSYALNGLCWFLFYPFYQKDVGERQARGAQASAEGAT